MARPSVPNLRETSMSDQVIKPVHPEDSMSQAPDINPETFLRLIQTIKYMTGIAERGRGYPCPDDVLPEKFLLEYVIELEGRKSAPTQEPVMIYHGGGPIDCGEHGYHNMEMLKLIPAGTKLYTTPPDATPTIAWTHQPPIDAEWINPVAEVLGPDSFKWLQPAPPIGAALFTHPRDAAAQIASAKAEQRESDAALVTSLTNDFRAKILADAIRGNK
jgi:hypothetical protein